MKMVMSLVLVVFLGDAGTEACMQQSEQVTIRAEWLVLMIIRA